MTVLALTFVTVIAGQPASSVASSSWERVTLSQRVCIPLTPENDEFYLVGNLKTQCPTDPAPAPVKMTFSAQEGIPVTLRANVAGAARNGNVWQKAAISCTQGGAPGSPQQIGGLTPHVATSSRNTFDTDTQASPSETPVRYLFVPPTTGTYTCSLWAFGNKLGQDTADRLYLYPAAGNGTYLERSLYPVTFADGDTTGSNVAIAKDATKSRTWNVAGLPPGPLDVVTDLQLTNCYNNFSGCGAYFSNFPNSNSAVANTSVVARRFGFNGAECSTVTWTATKTVTSGRHHDKLYGAQYPTSITLPAAPITCLGPYSATVTWTIKATGNHLLVHAGPNFSNVFMATPSQ